MEITAAEYYKQLAPKDMTELLGISKRTLWNYVNDGIVPRPHYPKPKQPKWKLGEVIAVYEQHLQMSDIGMTDSKAAKTPEHKVVPKKQEQTLSQKLKSKFGI